MEPQALSQPALTDPFRVGDWLAEPMANRLTRGDDVRRLEPKVMEVLACMAERPGETITKEEFMDDVWAGTVVTDDVLARCISELRKALGDRARSPEYVETIRKRGYVLIAPVEKGIDLQAEAEKPPPGDGAAVTFPLPGGETRITDTEVDPGPAPDPEEAPAATGYEPVVTPAEARARLQRLKKRQRVRMIGMVVAGLAFAAVASAVAYRFATDNVLPLSAIPITSYAGEERDPALSPDGESVAFSWSEEGGAYNIFVQPVEGGAPIRLSDAEDDERSPAWSPDGNRLAFARCTSDGCKLFTVDAGSERSEAIELADLGGAQVRDLVWSPDGFTLAFSARAGSKGGIFAVYLIALDGSAPKRLTAPPSIYPGDLDPAFSPDGRTLAFVRTTLDGRQDVCLVSVEGGEVERLAREQKGVTGLDWTSDGREVVYAANRDGAAGLWRVRRTGGSPRWVALGVDGGEVSSPSTARNASGIAFARQMVRSHVAELETGGTSARVLVRSTREDAHPSVSPDGSQIAFVSQRSGSHEIWTTTAAGENPTRLTEFGGPRVATPRWSPDGSLVALSAREEANSDIFIVGPGGGVRQMTDDPGDDVAPSWSRDGRWLYFASNRDGDWQIYRRSLDDASAPERVTLYGGVSAEEGPGRTLLVVRRDERNESPTYNGGLYRLRLGEDGKAIDRQAARVNTRLSPADWSNWAVMGDYVYVLERRFDEEVGVIRIDPFTNEREWLASTSGVPEQPGLAVFPGAQRFLLSQSELTDSDVVLVRDFE